MVRCVKEYRYRDSGRSRIVSKSDKKESGEDRRRYTESERGVMIYDCICLYNDRTEWRYCYDQGMSRTWYLKVLNIYIYIYNIEVIECLEEIKLPVL